MVTVYVRMTGQDQLAKNTTDYAIDIVVHVGDLTKISASNAQRTRMNVRIPHGHVSAMTIM